MTGLSKEEIERLMDLRDVIINAIIEAARLVESIDPELYQEWNASGRSISDERASPSLCDVVDKLEERLEATESQPEELDSTDLQQPQDNQIG